MSEITLEHILNLEKRIPKSVDSDYSKGYHTALMQVKDIICGTEKNDIRYAGLRIVKDVDGEFKMVKNEPNGAA